MQSNTVRLSTEGSIGFLRLNRPDVHNAFNRELVDALTDAANWFDRKPEIKVVIVSGEGKSFCSGFDLDQFSTDASLEEVRSNVDAGRRMVQAIGRMRATTIASVHGACVGGGVVLMMACDFRYASDCAQFWLPETDAGIPLAWAGVPWLVREIGPALAAEFILSCRRITAAEAANWRVLNGVYEGNLLEQNVKALAERLCKHSSIILEATKSQLVAAKQSLCSDANAFSDAHVLYSALCDRASAATRAGYLEQIYGRISKPSLGTVKG